VSSFKGGRVNAGQVTDQEREELAVAMDRLAKRLSEPVMESFRAGQARRFAGVTGHQLRYWDKTGLAKPSLQSTGGRPGTLRLYSLRDLLRLRAIKTLIDSGISVQQLHRQPRLVQEKLEQYQKTLQDAPELLHHSPT
jgi:DNA-binding transcriptional MerR regulator